MKEGNGLKHIYKPGNLQNRPVLLLLHGTGGTEMDLLPIAERIDPEAAVLSIRGNVLENGMPRFFRRLAEGVFDEEDLLYRTDELKAFLDECADKYGFCRGQLLAIGYSNGANMAASLLFHQPGILQGAILHHPMVPRRGVKLPDLSSAKILITAGLNDPICPRDESEELKSIFEGANAKVGMYWSNRGHELTWKEAEHAASWYQKHFAK